MTTQPDPAARLVDLVDRAKHDGECFDSILDRRELFAATIVGELWKCDTGILSSQGVAECAKCLDALGVERVTAIAADVIRDATTSSGAVRSFVGVFAWRCKEAIEHGQASEKGQQ